MLHKVAKNMILVFLILINGMITVKSGVGKGTTVRVHFQ